VTTVICTVEALYSAGALTDVQRLAIIGETDLLKTLDMYTVVKDS
jgi:hypothetical protein